MVPKWVLVKITMQVTYLERTSQYVCRNEQKRQARCQLSPLPLAAGSQCLPQVSLSFRKTDRMYVSVRDCPYFALGCSRCRKSVDGKANVALKTSQIPNTRRFGRVQLVEEGYKNQISNQPTSHSTPCSGRPRWNAEGGSGLIRARARTRAELR